MQKNSLKLVSIILPTYNGLDYLRQSIDSCLNQTYKNIELLIVDDGSGERTVQIIKSYNDRRIKYIRHKKNLGLPGALNTGFAASHGDYLTWTSDDNFYALNAIDKMVSGLENNKNIDFIYTDYFVIYDSGKIKKARISSPYNLDAYNCVGACFLYKRNVYDCIGEYDTEFKLAEDYNYWLRVRKYFRMKKMNKFLYYYRRHRKSLSETNNLYIIENQAAIASKPYINLAMQYYHQGRVYFFKNDFDTALKMFKKTINIEPFNPYAWKFIVFIHVQKFVPGLAEKVKKSRIHN